MAFLIDGRRIADQMIQQIKRDASQKGIQPCLAVVLIGDNPSSALYVKRKQQACAFVGFISQLTHLEATVTEKEVLDLIQKLNQDSKVHGILLQLPLPEHLNKFTLLEAIDPRKDVDGLHSVNVGRLVVGSPLLIPCTPQGCLHLIQEVDSHLEGKDALVIGCSNLVGRPMAQLLLNEGCTVTIAHVKTKNLPNLCRRAEIVVSATGSPRLVKKDWVKPGAIVIDVGITREGERIVGDVETEEVATIAQAVTPVPGGVGPMTVAYLLKNTLQAAEFFI